MKPDLKILSSLKDEAVEILHSLEKKIAQEEKEEKKKDYLEEVQVVKKILEEVSEDLKESQS